MQDVWFDEIQEKIAAGGRRAVVGCCFVLVMGGVASGPAFGQQPSNNSPVNVEWSHTSTPDNKPAPNMSSIGPLDVAPTRPLPARPAAPPLKYTAMYKCVNKNKTTYQDTPCGSGGLYHSKDNPITPVYSSDK